MDAELKTIVFWSQDKANKEAALESLIQQEIAKAKFGIVANSLNLLNTEPIHTVERALLGDMERLDAELSQTLKEHKEQ